MIITPAQRTTVSVEVPASLTAMELPVGWSLDNWVEHRRDQIISQFPVIKDQFQEVPREFAEMLYRADQNEKFWEVKRQLVRLALRECMRHGKYATVDGDIIADRRMFHVDAHPTAAHDVDAIFAV